MRGRRSSTAASSRASTSVPFGIVVNRHGERFYDEGEDFWPKRYAIWGGLIARQPDQIAYSIIDCEGDAASSCRRSFRRSRPARSRELAAQLGLDPGGAGRDRRRRSTARSRPGTFDPAVLDDCRTEGLDPPKSHWARADRHAAVLRLPAAAGHHVHLSRA